MGLKKSGSTNDNASGVSDGKETSGATDLDTVLDTDLDTDLVGMNSTEPTVASAEELNNSTEEVDETTEAAVEDSTEVVNASTTVPPTTVNEVIEVPNVTPSPVATVVTDLLVSVCIYFVCRSYLSAPLLPSSSI